MANKFAFLCNHCGAVEPAESAGDNERPGACHVCRHGVKYSLNEDGTGFSITQDPDNWTILADLPAEELKKRGLTSEQVSKHTGKGSPPKGAKVVATAGEQVGSRDKTG